MAMHRRFLAHTGDTNLPFLVPHSFMMLSASDPEYPRNFPAGREPCETYVQERIPPLPLSIRSTLINRYCPDKLRYSVRKSRKDGDCRVRLYCGRRRGEERARQKRFFTLRNYGLCVDQMEDLDVDVDRAVRVLANALAICYWVARIDTNDCEWVFGLPRRALTNSGLATEDEKRMRKEAEVFNMDSEEGGTCEDMVVWMLDFDCAQPMAMDQKGVQQAVDAF